MCIIHFYQRSPVRILTWNWHDKEEIATLQLQQIKSNHRNLPLRLNQNKIGYKCPKQFGYKTLESTNCTGTFYVPEHQGPQGSTPKTYGTTFISEIL